MKNNTLSNETLGKMLKNQESYNKTKKIDYLNSKTIIPHQYEKDEENNIIDLIKDDDSEKESKKTSIIINSRRKDNNQTLDDIQARYPMKRGISDNFQIQHPMELRYQDIEKCLPNEFINDNMMNFYIKYLEIEKNQIKKDEAICFNTFFYHIIENIFCIHHDYKMINHNKWIKSIDVFSKKYLYIPIHEGLHWSLVIVAHPNCLLNNSHNEECCILHLDSLDDGHETEYTTNIIMKYLFLLCQEKDRNIKHINDKIYIKKMDVPKQNNSVDCGLFVLTYLDYFSYDAPDHINRNIIEDLPKKHSFKFFLSDKWFSVTEPTNLRSFLIYKVCCLLIMQNNLNGDVKAKLEELKNCNEKKKYVGPEGRKSKNDLKYLKLLEDYDDKNKDVPSQNSSSDISHNICNFTS